MTGYRVVDVHPRAKVITHAGVTYNSLKELAEAYNINESTLRIRMDRGYSLSQALSTPVYKRVSKAFEVEKTPVIDRIKEINQLWKRFQFKPNQNSRRGWLW